MPASGPAMPAAFCTAPPPTASVTIAAWDHPPAPTPRVGRARPLRGRARPGTPRRRGGPPCPCRTPAARSLPHRAHAPTSDGRGIRSVEPSLRRVRTPAHLQGARPAALAPVPPPPSALAAAASAAASTARPRRVRPRGRPPPCPTRAVPRDALPRQPLRQRGGEQGVSWAGAAREARGEAGGWAPSPARRPPLFVYASTTKRPRSPPRGRVPPPTHTHTRVLVVRGAWNPPTGGRAWGRVDAGVSAHGHRGRATGIGAAAAGRQGHIRWACTRRPASGTARATPTRPQRRRSPPTARTRWSGEDSSVVRVCS